MAHPLIPRPRCVSSFSPSLSLFAEVHAGPREICKTFLMEEEGSSAVYAEADKQKLRLAFKALVEACGRALQTNSEVPYPPHTSSCASSPLPLSSSRPFFRLHQLIDADGLALHEEMQQGFLTLTQILAPVLQPLSSAPAASASPSAS